MYRLTKSLHDIAVSWFLRTNQFLVNIREVAEVIGILHCTSDHLLGVVNDFDIAESLLKDAVMLIECLIELLRQCQLLLFPLLKAPFLSLLLWNIAQSADQVSVNAL